MSDLRLGTARIGVLNCWPQNCDICHNRHVKPAQFTTVRSWDTRLDGTNINRRTDWLQYCQLVS